MKARHQCNRALAPPNPGRESEIQHKFGTDDPKQCDNCEFRGAKTLDRIDYEHVSFKLCLNCFRGIIGTHSPFYARMVEAVAFDEEAQRRIEAREEETHRALSRAQAMLSGAQKRHADAAEAPELRRTVESLLAQLDRKDDELDALKARLNAAVSNIEHHPDDLREIDRLLAVEAGIWARIVEFEARAQEDKLNRAYVLAASST